MRILHLCTSIDPSTGGPANVLARLAPAQAALGHSVSIITADSPDTVADLTASLASSSVILMAGGPASGPFARGTHTAALVRSAFDAGVDIVHIHGLWQHTPHHGARRARARGIAYVFRPCGMLDPWSLRQGALKKKLFLTLGGRRDLNSAAALHYTTTAERDLAAPLHLAPPPYVIPNGIDWAEFVHLPPRGAFRARHNLGDCPLIVFFSRLHHKKGLDLLLPAFASLPLPEARLVLVGPGEESYIAHLKSEAARLAIADRLLFTGMLTGPARFAPLIDADLFCLPSYQENFGVAVIEALACSAPALISDQVNIWPDVVSAGAGRAVPCTVEAVGEALRDMLSDRAALRSIGGAARAWVEKTYPWPAIARQIDVMYTAALSRR